MRQFAITIDIDAPQERVWAIMSDVERWHEWTPSVTSVRWVKGRELRLGNRALIRQPKFPPALWTVTSVESGRSFTWVSVAPGLRVTGHHAVEATASGSRATLSIDMDGMFGGLWGRLTRNITERYIALEADGLKASSEKAAYRAGLVTPSSTV